MWYQTLQQGLIEKNNLGVDNDLKEKPKIHTLNAAQYSGNVEQTVFQIFFLPRCARFFIPAWLIWYKNISQWSSNGHTSLFHNRQNILVMLLHKI